MSRSIRNFRRLCSPKPGLTLSQTRVIVPTMPQNTQES
jgi:hypothetical protein